MGNDPTRLGTVEDVKGATVSVVLDQETVSGLAFVNGYGYRIGQVGSFVRIPIGYVDLLASFHRLARALYQNDCLSARFTDTDG